MDFCNKMDFLMKLTQMKNKELDAPCFFMIY